MKIPATQRRYCPYCRKHTLHTVKIEKVRKTRRALSLGERKKRRRARGHGNHGKYSKRPIGQRKRVVKSVHKVDLRLTCKVCGKTRSMGLKRSKKPQIVAK